MCKSISYYMSLFIYINYSLQKKSWAKQKRQISMHHLKCYLIVLRRQRTGRRRSWNRQKLCSLPTQVSWKNLPFALYDYGVLVLWLRWLMLLPWNKLSKTCICKIHECSSKTDWLTTSVHTSEIDCLERFTIYHFNKWNIMKMQWDVHGTKMVYVY